MGNILPTGQIITATTVFVVETGTSTSFFADVVVAFFNAGCEG